MRMVRMLMDTPVTVSKKKSFLSYFLRSFTLKNIQCRWLIESLLKNDYLLENIHFVSTVDGFPKGCIISTTCTTGISFQFHKKHVVSNNIEQFFHEIRLHPTELTYIELNFKNSSTNQVYQSLITDQYFIKENDIWKKELAAKTDEFLSTYKKEYLKKQIDDALDNQDEERFLFLTKQLQKFINKKGLI